MEWARPSGFYPVEEGVVSEIILYHLPNSFYSQIARIVLAEKGVSWTSRIVTTQNYDPWYLRLNPMGTVPTMVHDGHPVPDSFAIARYVDANFEGPPLIPATEGVRAEVERWIGKLGDISIRELAYGTGKTVKIGGMLNRARVRKLKRMERRNPDLAEVYQAKQRDIEGFAGNALDAGHVERLREQALGAIDEMNAVLARDPWICGDQYSMADAIWTVAVALFILIGMDPLAGRPALAIWYARVKARPSFRKADIWESRNFSRVLLVILKIYWLQLAMATLVIGSLAAMVWLLA